MAAANPDGAPSQLTRVEVLGNIGPNWFASVMGTGIVAIAGASLPVLTFPVGTFVTGTSQLAAHTHLPAFKVAAAVAYAGLLCTWLLVAGRTARDSLRGNLLKLPPSSAPVRARKDRVS